jgi:hypothetical protein
MLARGFTGQLRTLAVARFRAADGVFAVLAVAAPIAVRVAVERMA